MKWLLPTLALLMPGAAHAASYNLTASPASPPPPQSGAYYITPGGDDTEDGQTIATAWATPNHQLNCSAFGGDVLHVQPGTYRSSNFHLGRWGPVGTGCQPGTFRTIECDGPTIHSCIVDDAGSPGFGAIWVSSPYWIVKGFEATANHSARDPCLSALNQGPSSRNKGHHIVFINNWAHDCYRASGGSDYVAYIAFMSYHSAYSSTESGISYYELAPVDTNPGTHVFGAGLFIFKAQNPPRGTDGECFIFDDWDHKQSNSVAYTMRGVIEQSIFAGCGSNGVEAFSGWTSSHYLLSSTLWGNSQSTTTTGNALGEVSADSAPLNIDRVIMQSTESTNTHYVGNPPVLQTYSVYALVCGYCSGTVMNSDYFGVGGQNYFGYHHNEAPGFDYTFGAGNVQVDPQFVSPAIPASTPDCGNAATVIVCAAPIIAAFKTQNPAVAGMGYQPPGACAPDQYWPSLWLPVSLVPDGLVTKPCS